MKNLLPIFILTIFSFFVLNAKVNALIPGSVEGNVYIQLPDGERINAPNARIYRVDFWNYSYCETEKCFGYRDGVETAVQADGKYTMGNNENTPGASCYEINDGGNANLCPAGEKGKIDYSLSANGTVNECSKDSNGVYYTPNLNWCGFNCGSNPHKWEAYFPEGYNLPGNLENLGYSHLRGSWKTVNPNNPGQLVDTPYYEEQVGNEGKVFQKDFVFVLEAPQPTPTPTPPPSTTPTPTPSADLKCVRLEGKLTSSDGTQTYTFANAPKGFTGKLELTCTGQAKVLPINKMVFSLEKVTQGQTESKEITGSQIQKITSALCQTGFECYQGTTSFDITQIGKFKASSLVCNNEICK